MIIDCLCWGIWAYKHSCKKLLAAIVHCVIPFVSNNYLSCPVLSDGVPPDGIPIEVVHSHHTGLVVSYYLLATVGIAFTCVCLAFNFLFRKRKWETLLFINLLYDHIIRVHFFACRIVKMTSPNLNYVIVAGALLMFISVYIDLIPTTDSAIVYTQCIVRR